MANQSEITGVPKAAITQTLSLTRSNGLELRLDTPKGRGVFASQLIAKGSVIDVSPVLVFTEVEVEQHTSQTCLQHYTYYWPSADETSTTQAIALGLGSMFNHSTLKQNVVWHRNIKSQCIIYTARNDIQPGEELCIAYGNGRLWFKDTDEGNSDDDWNKLRSHRQNLEDTSEIELSGIGNIGI